MVFEFVQGCPRPKGLIDVCNDGFLGIRDKNSVVVVERRSKDNIVAIVVSRRSREPFPGWSSDWRRYFVSGRGHGRDTCTASRKTNSAIAAAIVVVVVVVVTEIRRRNVPFPPGLLHPHRYPSRGVLGPGQRWGRRIRLGGGRRLSIATSSEQILLRRWRRKGVHMVAETRNDETSGKFFCSLEVCLRSSEYLRYTACCMFERRMNTTYGCWFCCDLYVVPNGI